MPHVSLLLILILCLLQYPQFVLCTKCYVFLTSSFAAAHTDRRNMRAHSKESIRRAREKFSEIRKVDGDELGEYLLTD